MISRLTARGYKLGRMQIDNFDILPIMLRDRQYKIKEVESPYRKRSYKFLRVGVKWMMYLPDDLTRINRVGRGWPLLLMWPDQEQTFHRIAEFVIFEEKMRIIYDLERLP